MEESRIGLMIGKKSSLISFSSPRDLGNVHVNFECRSRFQTQSASAFDSYSIALEVAFFETQIWVFWLGCAVIYFLFKQASTSSSSFSFQSGPLLSFCLVVCVECSCGFCLWFDGFRSRFLIPWEMDSRKFNETGANMEPDYVEKDPKGRYIRVLISIGIW